MKDGKLHDNNLEWRFEGSMLAGRGRQKLRSAGPVIPQGTNLWRENENPHCRMILNGNAIFNSKARPPYLGVVL